MKDELDPYSFGTESAFVRIRKEKRAEKNIEKTQEVTLEEPKKEKKEKVKKPKKSKKVTEAPKREPRVRQTDERTYLDDFSDMLSELEEYKNRPEETDVQEKDGDGQ